jgi:hypothetical protein
MSWFKMITENWLGFLTIYMDEADSTWVPGFIDAPVATP